MRTSSLRAILTAGVLALCVSLGGCETLSDWEDWSSVAPAAPVSTTVGTGGTQPPGTPSHPAADGREGSSVPVPAAEEVEAGLPRKIELRGRIEADAIVVNQSTRDEAILGDFENAVGFRRARLGAQGTIGEQVRWLAEFDFAGGGVAFKDVYLALEELPVLQQVRVGHFSEPFSLEGEISSTTLTFVERSPINALDPDRNWGLGFSRYAENQRATLAFGAFRSGSDDSGTDIGDANDMAYTARVTGLPWYDAAEGHSLMHVGAAFSQRFAANDTVTFKQGPRSSLLQTATDNPLTPFVPNIAIPASQNQLYNLQTAVVLGPLSFQAEWYGTTIDQIRGGPVFLHGSYAYTSWFITGESRAYDRKQGAFQRTRVRSPFLRLQGQGPHVGRGPGAWELAARFAYLDFSDSDIPRTATGLKQGNRLAQTTIGVNWYLNDYTRIMLNYVHAIPVDPNFGASAADAVFIRSEVSW